MSTIELQVADRFPAGTKVEVHPRVHDFFTPGQTKAVKTATVEDNGLVKVSGLVEHGPYFLAGQVTQEVPTSRGPQEVELWRSIAFTASDPAPALNRDDTNETARLEGEARAEVTRNAKIELATAPAGGPQIVVGPRNTVNSKIGASPAIAKTVPFPKIEDQKAGTPLRSHTETGEAHPVPADERQPKPAQSDVPKGTKQRSDTELGEATPVDPGEVQPGVKQEDFRGKQASDTETGEAAPIEAEEPRSTRSKSEPARSKSRQAKRQKTDKATSTGKAQARSQAADTTKKGKSK